MQHLLASIVASFLLSGCAAILLVPKVTGHLAEGIPSPTGFEFHRAEGKTDGGEPFRIRHLIDPENRHRFVVVLIDGKVFSSRRDDVTRDIEAARTAYRDAQGKTEAEVARMFGAPKATSHFEDVRVLWYPGERDVVFALVFRQGRYVTAFRTDRAEMERILDKPAPYAANYGLSPPMTNLPLAAAR